MRLAEAQISLLTAMRAAAGDRAALAAKAAHRELRLHEPAIEEIGAYRKNTGTVMAQAALRCAEALLCLRTKTLKGGHLKKERMGFQKEVEMRLCGSVTPKDGKHVREFGKLAISFSRLFALHYVDENGMQPKKPGGMLEAALPALAGHLMAELELCVEARFANPSKNLCKVSVFDIQDKLDALKSHPDEVVRRNAPTIIYAALHKANLGLADELAEGAKAKLDALQKHADEVVRRNAKTIVYTALRSADLGLADELAEGAKAKLDALQKHADEVVRRNAKTIVYTALNNGDLKLADRLAEGAKAKLDALQKHADEVVRRNAPTIVNAALNRGNLGLADELADGAAEAYGEMKKRLGEDAGNLRMRFSMMLSEGTLDVEGFLKAAA